MGNNASSGERRTKPGDPFPLASRMEGHAISIDRPINPKQLLSQGSEDDQAPVFYKSMKSAEKDSLSIPHTVLTDTNKRVLPCVIKWHGGGKDVSVAGTFNNWQALPMVKSEIDFVAIVDLIEGRHEYKFFVDGEWKVDTDDNACKNNLGTENNVINVKDSDFAELENALLKDPNDKSESPYGGSTVGLLKSDVPDEKDQYNQEIPEHSASEKKRGPPILPPHLLQVILNKDTPVSCEPTLLPEPNHVMLNHMYALSIRDGMMVLSTSHRYRKKCVTTLIYRPI